MAHQLSSTISKVLDILNDGTIHAGSDIAETLAISRTAVWKIIQRLKKYHVDIHSQHQGYQLTSPLILFDKKKIENLVGRSKITLEVFEKITSTNNYLKDKVSLKIIHFCLAEYQSKGRGAWEELGFLLSGVIFIAVSVMYLTKILVKWVD